MSAQSNVNLNPALFSGNSGIIPNFPDLGILRAIVKVPKGTVIPATAMVSQSAFATYVNAKFLLPNTDPLKWYFFNQLDGFKENTENAAKEKTGRLNLSVYSFPTSFECRHMVGAGNYIEDTKFNNSQGQFDDFYIDDFGNWHGTVDITGGTLGLACYTVAQFFVPNRRMRTTSTGNMYMLETSLADTVQTNGNFKVFVAGTQPDALVGLQNAVLQDISDIIAPAAPTTTITFTIKSGQDSFDVVKAYLSTLTAACFVATNLTAGGTAISATPSSITTGTNVVSGQTYYWVKAVLSAAPTAGNVVRIALAAPSVVNAIIPNFNMESIIGNNVNGQNCCIHTF
ncbi:MAG: hypothetical protein K0Q79_2745 [Flavipsychrobacter sp.]|jgi:hypothetical protein|nr:hypothetical protein [Flavipsychrobacter sp.]